MHNGNASRQMSGMIEKQEMKKNMDALDKQFGITEAGSTVNGELRAGLTTFLTMAYILIVNPAMSVSYTHLRAHET